VLGYTAYLSSALEIASSVARSRGAIGRGGDLIGRASIWICEGA